MIMLMTTNLGVQAVERKKGGTYLYVRNLKFRCQIIKTARHISLYASIVQYNSKHVLFQISWHRYIPNTMNILSHFVP